ncbi:MAG: ABC transporter ATP-binding protein [Sulfolobales archaeon]
MILRIDKVDVYYDSLPALKNVSLELSEGEMIFVLGPNGAGKTSLLKTIANLVKPRSGAVYIDGKELSRFRASELGKIIGFVDPYINRSLPSTVMDLLLTARYPHENPLSMKPAPDTLKVINEVIESLNIKDFLDRRLDQLSSGELQRVLLARVFIQKPKILLLDEPSAFLDIRYRLEILDTVERYTRINNSITIIAMHDLYLASRYADKIVLLDKGEIIAAGRSDEVLRKELIEKVYGVEVIEVPITNNKKIIIPFKRY